MKNITENTGKTLLVLFYFIISPFNSFGQSTEFDQHTRSTINLYFDCNSCSLYKNYHDNATELYKLDSLLSDSTYISCIDTIRICAFSSVDGNKLKNLILGDKRANAIRDYIICHHPQYDNDNLFVLHSEVGKWENFECVILNHPSVPHKKEMLDIIKSNLSNEVKEYRLRTMYSGSLWNFIKSELLPSQRFSNNMIIYKKKPIHELTTANNTTKSNKNPDTEFLMKDTLNHINNKSPLFQEETDNILEPCSVNRKYLFALKTNLLFDIASLLNVEIEVPLGKRWSVAGEYMFPWWQGRAKDWAMQVISVSVEGRYWFGNRDKLLPMTGFFTGMYAGGGYYDLENHSKGYQGEFFIASGISSGYAHNINKNGSLRMEYSLGVGYLRTKYRYYKGEEDNKYFVWQNDGHYTWIGPTKAKISLVWLFSIKKGGKK